MNPIPSTKWIFDPKIPLIIAGPCSAESEEQVIKTAKLLSANKMVKVFRAGIWKPRTRPSSFEGVGKAGLPWLLRVKRETGLMTSVEVAKAEHVELALEHEVDVLWIGARTTVSPFSVQEIADALRGSEVQVMVKNPINADLALWIGALERVANAGINKLMAVHRGFSNSAKTRYRNPPMWKIPIELKRILPELPILCDPSHMSGKREMIEEVCQKAMDLDMDGLMIECHHHPDIALSDSSQQVTPGRLDSILNNLSYRCSRSSNKDFDLQLEELREKIDFIDHEIIEYLHLRKRISEKIGKGKAKNNITALQVSRMDTLLKRRMELGTRIGLRPEYIKEIYNTIHEESIKIQTDIMKSHWPIN